MGNQTYRKLISREQHKQQSLMNQKIKQVINKNAKFDAFASDLVHVLHMHRTEINGKNLQNGQQDFNYSQP